MEKLLKFLLFVSLFSCFSGAKVVSYSNEDIVHITDATVKIIKSCYADRKSIVIYKNPSEEILEGSIASLIQSNGINLFDSAVNISIENRKTMPLFVTTANSNSQLDQKLQAFKASQWWNIMADFFILDTARNCENAQDILRTAWKMNVATAFFLCRQFEQELIYTYNPYTNRAPKFWEEIKIQEKSWEEMKMQERPPSRWTLYRGKNIKGKLICKDFHFDRTKYLDGAVINVVVPQMAKGLNDPLVVYGKGETGYYNVRYLKMIKSVLNATIKVHYVGEDLPPKGQIGPCLQPLLNASCDLSICWRSYFVIAGLPASYPLAHMPFSIVTKHLGYYTPLENIRNFYGIVTLVSMIIILAMTFVVVIISDKKRRFSFAGFEVLRLVINTGLFTKMNLLSSRIFFAVIFLYFLIIHATFSGHISAFLTKDTARRNVETIDDLGDPRITAVFTPMAIFPQIKSQEVRNKVVIESYGFDCVARAELNESIACMYPSFYIVAEARKRNSAGSIPTLHITTKFLGTLPFVNAVRHDWPLLERFNKALMYLESTGFLQKWSNDITAQADANFQRQTEQSEIHVKKISLAMLYFAFNFWAAGLACATLVFIFERRKNVTIRRRYGHDISN